MVEQAWLDEGDIVVSGRMYDFYINYVCYVKNHYPNINEEVMRKIKEG